MPRVRVPIASWRSLSPDSVSRAALVCNPDDSRGDTVYGAVGLLEWLVDRQITLHIPVWDKSARPDGTFSRADFVFDQERNVYVCPGGAELTSTGNIDQSGSHPLLQGQQERLLGLRLKASKPRCTAAARRKVTRDLNEDVRDNVRALTDTDAFHQSHRERKKVEMRFAHMKRVLRLDRLRLWGLSGARDEVLLTATAQNLKRLVKLLGRDQSFAAACLT
jgi:Transposase DDE domain